jgi:hypothetical protein
LREIQRLRSQRISTVKKDHIPDLAVLSANIFYS